MHGFCKQIPNLIIIKYFETDRNIQRPAGLLTFWQKVGHSNIILTNLVRFLYLFSMLVYINYL